MSAAGMVQCLAWNLTSDMSLGGPGALRQACPGLLCGKLLGRLSLLQISFKQPQVLTGVSNKSEASVPSDHPEIAVAPVLQDILAVIRKSSAQFDNVCMATAMHKMGTIMSEQHMQPEDMALIARKPEFEHLKSMIGEPAADCSLNAWASWPVQYIQHFVSYHEICCASR